MTNKQGDIFLGVLTFLTAILVIVRGNETLITPTLSIILSIISAFCFARMGGR